VQSARAAAQPSRQNQKEKASDNSYHKILTTDLFNMSMEYNRKLCYSCIENSSYIKRRTTMQEISDQEFVAMLHQLPDKAAYVNYLKALAASPDPPPVSPAEAGA
jgi:hypothetical protein